MRILFITSNRIGDAVLSSGALAWLHDEHPAARITIVCGPEVAPLFSHVPNLERVIPFRRQRWSMHWLALWRRCVASYWSIVVDMRRSLFGYVVPSGRRYRMVHDREGVHKIRQVADTMGLSEPVAPKIWVGREQRAAASDLVPDGGPVLALGPTANWGGKQWAAEKFATLIERLTAPGGVLAGARVAVFSAPGERDAALRVFAGVPEGRQLDFAGKTDLLTAYACLERCELYVGNDSGLMHLAAAAGVPTVGLFGPSKQEHYAPWGERTRWVRTALSYDDIVGAPDYDHASPVSRMDSLSVDSVVATVEDLWSCTHAPQTPAQRAAYP